MSASREYQAAVLNFREARGQAALQEILARFTGQSTQLLSYREVAEKLHLGAQAERGIRSIPVKAIIGSVGRYGDFTRTFLPRQAEDEQRWARVKTHFGEEASAIQVYQVGEAYFVIDGNHRVSVARRMGILWIDAHVIEVQSPVPLTPEVRPDDLIAKAEYADLLAETHLLENCPDANLIVTVPGQYRTLRAQIQAHRQQLEESRGEPVTVEQAAADWFNSVYSPFVEAIRQSGVLRLVPERTETDLYIWVSEHRDALEKDLGWAIRPEAAVADLAVRRHPRERSKHTVPGRWRRTRLLDRYSESLFRDILIPVSGSEAGWCAVDQAVLIAQREHAALHALHLVTSEAERHSAEALRVEARFHERCQAAGVACGFALETGSVVSKIRERAVLADLVVLNYSTPPARGVAGLGSNIRRIIIESAPPLLILPGTTTPCRRALLAYDGSPKSKEALFVATYFAEQWQTQLTVVTVLDGSHVTESTIDYARDYLEMHEIQAEYIVENRGIPTLLDHLKERAVDLVLLGGYSMSAVQELFGRSAVNWLLRESNVPLLVCR